MSLNTFNFDIIIQGKRMNDAWHCKYLEWEKKWSNNWRINLKKRHINFRPCKVKVKTTRRRFCCPSIYLYDISANVKERYYEIHAEIFLSLVSIAVWMCTSPYNVLRKNVSTDYLRRNYLPTISEKLFRPDKKCWNFMQYRYALWPSAHLNNQRPHSQAFFTFHCISSSIQLFFPQFMFRLRECKIVQFAHSSFISKIKI